MASATTKKGAAAKVARSSSGREILTFGNDFWSLEVELEPHLNPRNLIHKPTGRVIADQDYCYLLELAKPTGGSGFSGGAVQALALDVISWDLQETTEDGRTSLTVTGRFDFGRDGPTDIALAHTFTLFEGEDRFEEQIALEHRFGRDLHVVSDFRFGFRKKIFDSATAQWVDGLDRHTLTPIPFRRHRGQTQDHLANDYSAADLVPGNWLGDNHPRRQSEAWSWHGDGIGFCFAKYCQEHIEFSLADGEFYTPSATGVQEGHVEKDLVGTGDVCLRFAGAGRTFGAPGTPVELGSHSRGFEFGVTTIVPFDGGWEDGHRAYARLMRRRGHTVPKQFNPPVHWNELYELSWRGGINAPLQELPQILEQAAIARQISAEAFYFDPVWDVYEGSTVWDEERFGPLPEFVARLKEEFGLKLSLHLMMHTKLLDDDPRIYRRDREGNIVPWEGLYKGGYVCPASPVWQDMKTERLLKLARAGVSFFMFDFCDYRIESTHTGVPSRSSNECCWSPDHGHRVPMTLEEHADGLVEVMKRVKREFPDLLIEAHDRIAGGTQEYLPLYYQHGGIEPAFDEHWGFEFMWNSYMDLLSGKALSLYEYNLAYDIPLYLHINLAFDNRHALSFWWYASTCRHLGIGGVKPGNPTWDVHVTAMQTYLRLKPHFTRGRFAGIDRMVHAHVLDDERSAVIVAFNLESRDQTLDRAFSASMIGAPETLNLKTDGLAIQDGNCRLSGEISGLSPRIIEVSW